MTTVCDATIPVLAIKNAAAVALITDLMVLSFRFVVDVRAQGRSEAHRYDSLHTSECLD